MKHLTITLLTILISSLTFSETTILQCEYKDYQGNKPPNKTSGEWNNYYEVFKDRCDELMFWNWAANDGKKIDEEICYKKGKVNIYFDESENFFSLFSANKNLGVNRSTKLLECFDAKIGKEGIKELCKFNHESYNFYEDRIVYYNHTTFDYKNCAEKAVNDYRSWNFDKDCLNSSVLRRFRGR